MPKKITEQNDDKTVQARRAFLKGAGVAGVAAAIGVVTQTDAEAKSVETEDASGYRETAHISAYYDAAKF